MTTLYLFLIVLMKILLQIATIKSNIYKKYISIASPRRKETCDYFDTISK
jgi:hypothetical protein